MIKVCFFKHLLSTYAFPSLFFSTTFSTIYLDKTSSLRVNKWNDQSSTFSKIKSVTNSDEDCLKEHLTFIQLVEVHPPLPHPVFVDRNGDGFIFKMYDRRLRSPSIFIYSGIEEVKSFLQDPDRKTGKLFLNVFLVHKPNELFVGNSHEMVGRHKTRGSTRMVRDLRGRRRP